MNTQNIQLNIKELELVKEKSLKYYNLNFKMAQQYTIRYKKLNITNIALLGFTTLSDLVISLENIFGVKLSMYYSPVRLFLLIFITVLTNVIHFLEYEKFSEMHNKKANSFLLIYNNIHRKLDVYRSDPNFDEDTLLEFYTFITQKYDELLTSEPISTISYELENKRQSDVNILIDSNSRNESLESNGSNMSSESEDSHTETINELTRNSPKKKKVFDSINENEEYELSRHFNVN